MKNAFLGFKKDSSKCRKIAFFPKGKKRKPIVFVQKWLFFQLLFFLGKKDKEKGFYDILERKNAFPGYKNKQFKKSKNSIFPKGLTHDFGSKMAILLTSFF